MSDKITELGIPQYEITPSVSVALNGLFDHVEQLNAELQRTKTQLSNLQNLIDVEVSPSLPNRRAFIQRLDWAIAMSKRYSGSACVTIFNFADYDSVSRTYGYQAANRTSNYLADFLHNSIRDTDFFARLSDTQYGIIMFFAGFDDVVNKADSMRNSVRQSPMKWNNGLININLSVGVHAITPADSAESAIMAATNAMYTDKQKLKFEEINIKA